MKKASIARFLILRTIGNFLLIFAIFGVLATFGPALVYEVQFRIIQVRGVHYTIAASTNEPSALGKIKIKENLGKKTDASFADVLAGPQEQILTPKDPLFSILIPKIGANSKVFPNVNPADENQYLPVLQQGVAHASGTVFPGMKGNIYLFAHSTDNFWDVGRYNAIFYLLKDLQVGDDIVIFFENVRHNYVVTETKIVDQNDVSYIVKSQNTGEEKLILQTCWPPGTTWKRLLVIAKPIKSN